MAWPKELTPSIQGQVKLKKTACLFAGLGHLQPLLLVTTNSHYLLDRFCMERCCSGEYISRIVTSIIFMEILSIIMVRIVLYMVFKNPATWTQWKNWQGNDARGQTLNSWNEKDEKDRDYISTAILLLITLGYLQIFYAFTTGGKKGHMHWFYASLLIQHFLNSLIAGSIGFWEVGLALWYLVTLPMAPIIVFFYQMIIHSWIRNNGPRDVEYIVVEYQIWLALSISVLATILWTAGYVISYVPIELEIEGLDSAGDLSSTDTGRITSGNGNAKANAINLTLSGALTANPVTRLSEVQSVALTGYSLTLIAAPANLVTVTESDKTKMFVTVALTGASGQVITVNLTAVSGRTLSATKAALTEKDITLTTTPSTPLKVYSATPVTVAPSSNNTATITIQSIKAEGILPNTVTITNFEITIPVTITLKSIKAEETASQPVPINSVKLILPTTAQSKLKLTAERSDKTLTINVQAAGDDGSGTATAQAQTVDGKGFYPKKKGYCIYSVREGNDANKDIWANISGKCEYVACYYKNDTSDGKTQALLMLYFRSSGGSPERRYFGTEDAGKSSTEWKTITEDKFIECIKTLATTPGTFSLDQNTGTPTAQYNREYHNILKSPVWFPLLMQGLSVGAVGSIFPNLIPKTLTCPKTTRNLSVMNMFLVTVPHIFNVMLGDMDLLGWIGVGDDWTKSPCWLWPCSLLLYLIYGLAILFAIFNIHYPEWALSTFLRNNTWMVFLMILFTDVLNETFNAISRAGICSQKAADGTSKNHPCLHNKIACLMNLTYIPFWMTTTPMKDL